MQTARSPQPENVWQPVARQASKASAPDPRRELQHVPTGEKLFEPGQHRRLYRVESGAICHYMRTPDGKPQVIEFAFPGDVVGIGHATTHVSTAKAMVDTDVTPITEADLNSALQKDDKLFFHLADAGEREFDYFRNRSLEGDLLPPLERVASFLLAIASINSSEGRDATLIADDISSGYVADQLQISIDTLTTVLLSLQLSGFVAVSDAGLRVLDTTALEKLAAA
jgi:CRP/FNR family transcriptional regulator